MDFLSIEKRFGTSFDEDWWDGFLAETQELSIPCVIRDVMTNSDTARMRRNVLDIIADLASTHKEKYGLRLWVDGQSVDNSLIFANPPLPDDTIETWTSRVFKGIKFGIILNRGEKFSESLSHYISSSLAPFIAKNGMPTEGLLFTLFIGNYDKTPLGIHKDLPGKSVIQFHLGPGPKEMYTWVDGILESQLGPRPGNVYDVEPHLSSATRHVFFEGDIYYMPENLYHVGRQDDLSITVGCWYNNRTDQHFAERLLSFLVTKYLQPSRIMMKADQKNPEDTSVIGPVLDLFKLPSDYRDLNLRSLLREIYRDFRMALFSNGALRNAPIPNSTRLILRPSDTVRLQAPYRILYRSGSGGRKVLIFARGSMIEANYSPDLIALIDRLNRGHPLTVAEIMTETTDAWPAEAAAYFVRWFHEVRAIQVADGREDNCRSCIDLPRHLGRDQSDVDRLS